MKIYDILGVNPNASIDEIRQAYQQKLKQIDMSKNINEYQELREAYNLALKQIRTNETIPEEVISTSQNNSFITEEETKIDESPEPEEKESVVPVSVEPKVADIAQKTQGNSFEISFMSFLDKKELYTNFSNWENLLHPFILNGQIPSNVKQRIKLFLLKNYMLVEDSLRFKLLKLVNLTESDFSTADENKVFKEKIYTKDHLDLSFYSYIPKGDRDNYFINRYELYQVIQKGQPINSIGINTINILKKSDYDDDDLAYLLIVYALLTPNFLPTEEIQNKMNSIQKDMYLHDLEVFNKFVALIENNQAPMVSNIDIIGLSWVSDSVKEKLMSRLKEIRRTLPKETTIYQTPITRHTKKNHPQPFNVWKMILLFFLGITFVFGIISFISSVGNNNDHLTYLDDWDIEDDEMFNEEYDEVSYKQETRTSNVKLNYNIYTMLLHDDVLDTEFVAISDKAKNSLEAFKEKNQETFDNLEINDMFQDINETHELTESETVITYSSFKNENLFLKSTTNQLNEIISIEEIPKEDMPHNRELGNLDATLFFSNDLISYYDDLDNYLIDLEKLYNTYLTDELYEKITQIDEEQFMYLSEFGFSKPHLLAIPNKQVLVLTNFDDEFLFLELNDELKIETIYLDFFNTVPEEYVNKANELSNSFDTDNPWAYELGFNL
ncbi:J domain-containing protein [Vagococcus fluvialis]|uniref:J domain-containing protein n=1 Tax=Vagococcus fluvialis TaxID=2738 RepID=UPI003D10680F